MVMMPRDDSSVPGLSHASVSNQWYRFEIDCAAHPTVVNVKSLIREADGPRRKVKSSTSAPTTTTDNDNAFARGKVSTSTGQIVLAAAAGAGVARETPIAPSTTVDSGGVSDSTTTGNSAAGGEGGDAAASVVSKTPTLSAAAELSGGASATTSDAAATAAIDGATEEAQPSLDTMDVEPEPTTQQQRKVKPKGGPSTHMENRERGWMSLIERLELEHGGGGLDVFPGSSGSGSDLSEAESSDENGGSGGDGSDAAVDGGGGGGGKKKAKVKKKAVRRHSFDYEDDFIDDSGLEEAYNAREASKSVKTVHSGFFANQGSVTTVEPASVGGGVGGKGKSSSSGEGAGKTADGDVIVRKKNKRLTAPPANNETAGKSGATAPAKKKSKKVPTEGGGGGGGGKKPSKPAKPTATTTPSAGTTPGAATVASTGDDGSGGGHATPISSTTTSTATAIANPVGNQTNIAAAASGEIAAIPLEGDNDADAGSTAAATSGHDIAAQQCNGTVLDHACAPSGQIKLSSPDGTGAGKTEEAVAGAGEPSKGGGNGSGSEGEKGVKNGAKPAAAAAPPTMTTWDPTLQLAVSQFEKDFMVWVNCGRPASNDATRMSESMRVLDALVRQSAPDAHNCRSYLERLSVVYGRTPQDVKAILVGHKEEDDKRECARLQQEFNSLKSVFVSEVATGVGQLAVGGMPPVPPFLWPISLRKHLHDMLRAFEAWSTKEHGGLRKPLAVSENKALYDKLCQEWPAELNVTSDLLKQMYKNEKRRIKNKKRIEAKANREAAAEVEPATPTSTAGGSPPPAGGTAPLPPLDTNRSSAPGGSSASMPPPGVTPTPTSSSQQQITTPITTAAGVTAQQPIDLASPREQEQQASTTPVMFARQGIEAPASSASTSASIPAAVTPPTATTTPRAGTAREGGSLSYDNMATVALAPALSMELLPPRGVRFDTPPQFDQRRFEEETENGIMVEGWQH